MARTDKPPTNESIPYPERNLRYKSRSKSSKKRKFEAESNCEKCDNPPIVQEAGIPVPPEHISINPSYSISQRISCSMRTTDCAPTSDEHESAVQSPEYRELVTWFQSQCNFSQVEAEIFTFQLIVYHKITSLEMLFLLHLRDPKFLPQILSVGHLLNLEQMLFNHFYKKLKELSCEELYFLLRNSGFAQDMVEQLIRKHDLSGLFLASMPNLEEELVNLHLPSTAVKLLSHMVQEWKVCGVPRNYLQPGEGNYLLTELSELNNNRKPSSNESEMERTLSDQVSAVAIASVERVNLPSVTLDFSEPNHESLELQPNSTISRIEQNMKTPIVSDCLTELLLFDLMSDLENEAILDDDFLSAFQDSDNENLQQKSTATNHSDFNLFPVSSSPSQTSISNKSSPASGQRRMDACKRQSVTPGRKMKLNSPAKVSCLSYSSQNFVNCLI